MEICRLETIEIGAVMLDEDGKEIDSFKEYLKPTYTSEIPRNIEKLMVVAAVVTRRRFWNRAFG